MIPQLPPGIDATYSFTQSLPISVTATVIVVTFLLVAGWIAWCIAWAHVEEQRAMASRPPVIWPPAEMYRTESTREMPLHGASYPKVKTARKKVKP